MGKSSLKSEIRQMRIVEVGLRDGLQNEKTVLDVGTRVQLAERLISAGLRDLEVGAFVSPKWVPQMAGSKEIATQLVANHSQSRASKIKLSALVPNTQGLTEALSSGLNRIAVFASATETFSQKNINCSITESLTRYQEVLDLAKKRKVWVRGYLSMCFGCAFEGKVSEARVVRLALKLAEMGCDEISIGDTIGVADPKQVRRLGSKLLRELGNKTLAMHFHDTRGTALANVLASMDLGIEIFDSSIGGLGGCPYAPAATGNLATEDAVYMMSRMGVKTGVQLNRLIETTRWLNPLIGRELPSKVSRAGLG